MTSFFLREIPLRATRHTMTDELQELGIEFGAGVGERLPAGLVLEANKRAVASAPGGGAAG